MPNTACNSDEFPEKLRQQINEALDDILLHNAQRMGMSAFTDETLISNMAEQAHQNPMITLNTLAQLHRNLESADPQLVAPHPACLLDALNKKRGQSI